MATLLKQKVGKKPTTKISEDTEKRIIALVYKMQMNNRLHSGHARLTKIDKLLARDKAKKDENSLIVPIISPQVDSRVAYLAKLFLSGSPIFPVGTSPEGADVIAQYNTLLSKFSTDYQWKRNLMLAFKDGVKYNLMAVEANWTSRNVQTATNEIADGTLLGAKETEAGFQLKHLDLYNTFYDLSIAPAKVSQYGDYAGYTEVLTSTRLTSLLQSLPSESAWKHREKEIWAGAGTTAHAYYVYPRVNHVTQNEQDWDTLLSEADTFRKTSKNIEVTTVYIRLVPSEYGLIAPDPNTVQIFKFIIINGKYVVYAEPRSSFHQYLPIVFGQPNEDNLGAQAKSLVEELEDLQTMASSLWNMEIISNNRTVQDRFLYDPSMIDKKDIDSTNPISRIPVKPKATGKNLSEAIHRIPFEDSARGTRAQLAQGISSYANSVSGVNQVGQGQFIKGNKTDSQFDTVMANSDSRQIMMAVLLEDQFISVIKKLIKSDLLQYQEPLTLFNPQTNQEVKVDPAQMRKTSVNFLLADGLVNLDQEFSVSASIQFLQAISSSPDLQLQFNTGAVISYLAKLSGMKDMDKFLRSPQEIKAIQDANAAREAQATARPIPSTAR
jgi:hypothetical protein